MGYILLPRLSLCVHHRYQKMKNKLLKVCYVPTTSAGLPRVSFFLSVLFLLLQPLTVLMKQTRAAVCAVKQSIFLDVYGVHWYLYDFCLEFETSLNQRNLLKTDSLVLIQTLKSNSNLKIGTCLFLFSKISIKIEEFNLFEVFLLILMATSVVYITFVGCIGVT